MIEDIEKFKDVLEKHICYNRSTMRGYEQIGIKLVICPILDTKYSDIFVQINNNNGKWRNRNTIKQLLKTVKEEDILYYRAFLLSTAPNDLDVDNGLPIWIFSKENSNEKYILHILDITNIWEEN